jgi:Domain of unknown function (DUF6438)
MGMVVVAPVDEGYWRPWPGFAAAVLLGTLAIVGSTYFLLASVPTFGKYGPHRDFPAVRNFATLAITLERTPCYGMCPAYRVTIHGDGQVVYTGGICAAVRGERRARIVPAAVAALVGAFHQADFFSLRDRYFPNIVDAPTRIVTIAFDGRFKTVSETAGMGAGMPYAVLDLERRIDATAGTAKWAYGTGERHCP